MYNVEYLNIFIDIEHVYCKINYQKYMQPKKNMSYKHSWHIAIRMVVGSFFTRRRKYNLYNVAFI
jgi:hypothetical protein